MIVSVLIILPHYPWIDTHVKNRVISLETIPGLIDYHLRGNDDAPREAEDYWLSFAVIFARGCGVRTSSSGLGQGLIVHLDSLMGVVCV
jgi:hypothetical protein